MKKKRSARPPILAMMDLVPEVERLAEKARAAGVPERAIAIALLEGARNAALREMKTPAAVAWWLRSVADNEEADDDIAAAARRHQ
jgi:hypothetical protein